MTTRTVRRLFTKTRSNSGRIDGLRRCKTRSRSSEPTYWLSCPRVAQSQQAASTDDRGANRNVQPMLLSGRRGRSDLFREWNDDCTTPRHVAGRREDATKAREGSHGLRRAHCRGCLQGEDGTVGASRPTASRPPKTTRPANAAARGCGLTDAYPEALTAIRPSPLSAVLQGRITAKPAFPFRHRRRPGRAVNARGAGGVREFAPSCRSRCRRRVAEEHFRAKLDSPTPQTPRGSQ